MLEHLLNEMQVKADQEKAKILQRFFKTQKGQYGEGDLFIGLTMSIQREIAKKHSNLPISKIKKLLNSEIHEHRMTALIILTNKYKKASKERESATLQEIVNFYLKNTKKINNWDLVDLSCPKILGDYFLDKDKKIFYRLANSKNIWEKRISIVSTLTFIKNNKLGDTLKISEILLNDKNDLIHKAVGWMLREVGKKNQGVLLDFLRSNYKNIPRTTLRYSIERFPKEKRKNILKGKFS
jgi:3-methyladenine DNA glycosylase AlkD